MCRKGLTLGSDYICTSADNCRSLVQSINDRNYFDICSFNGAKPIVCCPGTIDEPINKMTNSYTADDSM